MTILISAINLVVIFLLAVWLRKKQDMLVRPLFWPALTAKLLGGLLLGIIYRYYYTTGDTFYFFDLASQKATIFQTDPLSYFEFLWHDAEAGWKGIARSEFFIKMVSIAAIITYNNYWITSLWFSFVSFLGSLYLVNCIVRFFPGARWAAAIAFLFFPSVVFWGSGVIKECIGLAALLALSGMFLKAMMNGLPRWFEIILGLFCLWIVWNLKYYWLAVFLPVVVTSLVVHFTAVRFSIPSRWKLPFWVALFVILCLGVSVSHPNFYLERFLEVVVSNHQAFVSVSEPRDLIHFYALQASWWSLTVNAPWALCSGLFRPFLWEADNLLKVVASIENFIILLLCISSLFRIKDFFRTQNRLVTMSVMVYIVLLCIFLALSTPNLGSLARYKVGFLPFLIFLISYKNPLIHHVFSWPLLSNLKKRFD